jgi:predicted kinase
MTIIVGPPAAGKSLILQMLIENQKLLIADQLDVYIDAICEIRGIKKGPINDDLIEEAARKLFSRKRKNNVVEIAHHDYIQLAKKGIINLDDIDVMLVVSASLDTCLKRNRDRPKTVPPQYIERCAKSLQNWVKYVSEHSDVRVYHVDSEKDVTDIRKKLLQVFGKIN